MTRKLHPGTRPASPTPETFADESVDQVRRYYDLVDLDDVSGLLSLFATDAVYRRPGYPPMRGQRELEQFYRSERVIAHGRHTLHTVVAQPGAVAVQGRFRGTLKDGTRAELEFADFFAMTEAALFARRDTFFFAPMV